MKKYIFILCLLLTFNSCKKFLTQEPIVITTGEKVSNSFSNLDLATAASYSRFIDEYWYGGQSVLWVEMSSSNGNLYRRSGRYTVAYDLNLTPKSTRRLWSLAYATIGQVNKNIEALNKLDLGSIVIIGEEGTPEELLTKHTQDVKNLLAENYFIRALAHFDLVKAYARPYNYTADASHLGVPVVTKVVPLTYAPKRNTVKEVYDQIISDLLEAEKIIADNYVRQNASDSKAVVSKEVIQALLSRVYLYSEQWQQAADYATKVINSKKYTMWTPDDLKDANCYAQNPPKGGEIIFEIASNVNDEYTPYREGTYYLTLGTYGDCGSSLQLYNMYDKNDVRKTLFTTTKDGRLYTLKYKGKGVNDVDCNNTVVLRLSEMYLNRAEAGLHGATGVDVSSDLSMIASNRGVSTPAPTLENVYIERWKELAWEGHLWYDCSRTKRTMERLDYIGEPSDVNIIPSDYRWASAIPESVLNNNKNLVQNEGY